MIRITLTLLYSVLLASCAFNDQSLKLVDDRSDYNERIRQTENEQLLGNIVRLRYNDTPFFLDLGSVVVQYGLETSTSGRLAFGLDDFIDGSAASGGGGLDGKLTWSEKPTVSYAPLQGEAYARRMLTSVPVEVLWLLSNSGWSLERLMMMTVEQMQSLPNAPTASGPQPAQAPEYRQFRQAAQLMRSLQREGGLVIALDSQLAERPVMLVKVVREQGKVQEQVAELLSLLALPADTDEFHLGAGLVAADDVRVKTRSLLGVLYFLANTVAVPEQHRRAGFARVAQNGDGSVFDWSALADGFMAIRHSAEQPAQAAVSTFYRGYWFYIDDSDPDSKATFSLLQLLFSLQSSTGNGPSPVLTLPAG